MPDRLTLFAPPDQVARTFGLAAVPALAPRYNLAPGQTVAAVGLRADGQTRGMVMMGWGLPTATAGRLRHAVRAETASRTPATRDAFARRRCLVAADGFYLWQIAGLVRVPHHVRRVDGGLLAFAGLWTNEAGADGGAVWACCVLTVPAEGDLKHLSDRVPAVLPEAAWDAWLSPVTPVAELKRLLRPPPAQQFAAVVVGPAVNDLSSDGPECVRPTGRAEHMADSPG